MTFAPPVNGTYIVSFSSTCSVSGSDTNPKYAIYKNNSNYKNDYKKRYLHSVLYDNIFKLLQKKWAALLQPIP